MRQCSVSSPCTQDAHSPILGPRSTCPVPTGGHHPCATLLPQALPFLPGITGFMVAPFSSPFCLRHSSVLSLISCVILASWSPLTSPSLHPPAICWGAQYHLEDRLMPPEALALTVIRAAQRAQPEPDSQALGVCSFTNASATISPTPSTKDPRPSAFPEITHHPLGEEGFREVSHSPMVLHGSVPSDRTVER